MTSFNFLKVKFNLKNLSITLSEEEIELTTYYRISGVSIKKPTEVNRELRVVYVSNLDKNDEENLLQNFKLN